MLDMGGKTSSIIRDIADGALVYVGEQGIEIESETVVNPHSR